MSRRTANTVALAATILAPAVEAPAEFSAPAPLSPVQARAQEIALAALAHPQVRDKSPLAIGSRVAQRLNAEGFAPTTGRYFTTDSVAALFGAPPPARPAKA